MSLLMVKKIGIIPLLIAQMLLNHYTLHITNKTLNLKVMNKLIYIFFFFLNTQIFGQELFEIKGSLKDINNNNIVSAAIKLLDNKDLTKIKYYAISDENGVFKLNNVAKGDYQLEVIFLGYKDDKRLLFINKNTNLDTIILHEEPIALNEVIVSAKEKIIKVTNAGIKLNVQGTNLAQKKDVLSILKYAPNVKGIEIAGSSAIKILLNGKEIKIKPEQFTSFLQSIKPNTIKNIEITDKTDASYEGNITGQINIITKKSTGFTGSLGSSVGYNNRFSATTDANIFYSENKFRFYTELYKSDHKSDFKEIGEQIIDNNLTYNIKSKGTLKRQERNFILGFDFDIDLTSYLSLLYNYSGDNDKDFNIISNQLIRTTIVKDSSLKIVKDFDHIDKTNTFSLQYQKNLDSLESNLKLSADYAVNRYKNPLSVKSHFFSNSVLVDATETFESDITNSTILGVKLDWKKNWKKGNNLSTGSKYSFNHNTENFSYFDKINNEFVLNQEFTNHFNFNESIYAFYLNYYFQFKKTSLTIGNRMEYNLNRFGMDISDKSVDNFKLLPTLNYNIPLNKNNTFNFYLAKKIDRPSYYNYNSTIIKNTPTQASSGNNSLKPTDIYILQLGYDFKEKYSLLANYSYQKNNVILTPEFVESEGYTLSHPVNSGYKNTAFLMLNIPVKYFKWWESTNKISFKYTNFFTPLILPKQNFESTFATINSYHTFNITQYVVIDLNFSYKTKYKNLYYKYADNFTSDITFSTPIFKKKFQFYFYISDLFNTERSILKYHFNTIFKNSNNKDNSRGIFLALNYNFSIGKEVDISIIESNIKDEKSRTKH